ncbi:hormogonium polysaccharide biosynthesis glycosyltransferase HpsE [Planktothrix mougeotii]|uniref:Glycosyltransferase family 2 protein n=1 Tax=Planktothrix mougeotii LEGE 06226 TaxID=1828728 RepID=A0ABR9UDN2_9CYAN|nr:hormogonium polysaccharide biosynthesis glycosyltransferase HpsE [Planktothrix mougeotii]MBE9144577.1 glycosyltransferase family 2 protein [Planktothrix mougeotii LEGE 06226]
MIDFTVVIPTYNGAIRVPDVLEKLRSQKGTENITWEIIVVDNNSHDQTANIIQEIITSWDELFTLRYIFEKQQGIAFARQRGVEESQGELIGFLDDDNFPDENWVLQAYLFGQEHPKAGSYGGQIHANYQVEPPQNFKRVEHLLLAIRESGDQPFLFCPEQLQLPSGAGLVVGKKAWLDHVPSKLVNTGRGGNDYEISLNLYRGGWEIWYNPKMHLDHYIPSERLDKKYLLSLASLYGLKSCEFRMLITPTWKKPLVFFKVMLGGIKRAIQYQIQHQKDINFDIVAACELKFFRASAISPFYFLQKAIFKKS